MSQFDDTLWDEEEDIKTTVPSQHASLWSNSGSYRGESTGNNFSRGKNSQNDYTWRNKTDEYSQMDSNPTMLTVPERSIGKVIGKGGSKIRELQEQSGARIHINKDSSGSEKEINLEGSESACQLARKLINDLVYGGDSNDQVSGFRSSYTAQADSYSRRSNNATPQQGACFKCGETGHISRDCTNGSMHRNRSCFKCGDEGHIGRDCLAEKRESKNSFGGNYNRSSGQQEFNSSGSSSFGATDEAPVQTKTIDWKALIEYGNQERQKRWDSLPPIAKNFYFEDPEVACMHPTEVSEFRRKNNNIFCTTIDEDDDRIFPNPVQTFEQAFLHYPEILEEIRKQGFATPSPIQCQAWPILLQGYDLIGVAQTGTGKTLAFLLPAFIHIDSQVTPRVERPGPSCLMLAPTRELAQQIERETKKYEYRGIKCVCLYGGGSRKDQINVVKKGVEIVIATPGRLNDLIMNKILDCSAVTYLVLDEADRMLDMGFEPQIRKVLLDIRPDRQTVMTSATWPEGVRRLAKTYMSQPFQVYIGTLDLAAVHSVRQEIWFVSDEDKRERLYDFLENMAPDEKVIVFCDKKVVVDDVASDLVLRGTECQCIHGDREQYDREQALEDLRDGSVKILVATDVASRGLDIKDISHVLNYDFPRNIEEYVHRVGRTGRAGATGTALSFMTRGDWHQAQHLIDIMTEAEQEIPEELISMAERYKAWKQRKDAEESSLGGGGRRGRGGGFRGGGGGRRNRW